MEVLGCCSDFPVSHIGKRLTFTSLRMQTVSFARRPQSASLMVAAAASAKKAVNQILCTLLVLALVEIRTAWAFGTSQSCSSQAGAPASSLFCFVCLVDGC